MVSACLDSSILGRASKGGILDFNVVNIRDYTLDKHKKVDDYTYGGGAGMLMCAQPVYDCWRAVAGCGTPASVCSEFERPNQSTDADMTVSVSSEITREVHQSSALRQVRTIYVTPQGRLFDQDMAVELSKESELIFICGHYEGIDERALEKINAEPVSIGDYVLTGGELPAVIMVDAISRLIPGVLHNEESTMDESIASGLLEYPQYSRPAVWEGMEVPEVLLSGHHKNIEAWRLRTSLERTRERRPDLYEKYILANNVKI